MGITPHPEHSEAGSVCANGCHDETTYQSARRLSKNQEGFAQRTCRPHVPDLVCAAVAPPSSRSEPPPPRRRNRTRQRERMLELLRETDRHPTAAAIHDALCAEFPSLSLGTVYRNLEVLAGLGHIREVPVPNGATRYDGKTALHHHFVCEVCDAIQDVEIRMPSGIEERVRRKYRLRPERFRIDFYGLCHDCVDRGSTPSNH